MTNNDSDSFGDRETEPCPASEETARAIAAANAGLCALAQISLARFGEPPAVDAPELERDLSWLDAGTA